MTEFYGRLTADVTYAPSRHMYICAWLSFVGFNAFTWSIGDATASLVAAPLACAALHLLLLFGARAPRPAAWAAALATAASCRTVVAQREYSLAAGLGATPGLFVAMFMAFLAFDAADAVADAAYAARLAAARASGAAVTDRRGAEVEPASMPVRKDGRALYQNGGADDDDDGAMAEAVQPKDKSA